MKKIKVILLNEIVTHINRRSFWIVTLGIPIMTFLVVTVLGFINQDNQASEVISSIFTNPVETRPDGYVDSSGLIKALPEGIPETALLAFPNEQKAMQALENGEITGFYQLPADYLQSGQIIYVTPDMNPLASEGGGNTDLFRWVVQVNLLNGDGMLAGLVKGPFEVQNISLAPPETQVEPDRDESPTLVYWMPYAVALLFYMLVMITSSLLLSNISKEKENRVIEILLNSVTPTQLMVGKIVGLGLVSLFQAGIFLLGGYLMLNSRGTVLSLPPGFEMPPSILAWGITYFILGYAVYASLMAGLGALAPNLREASQVTIVIMIPLIVPIFFSSTVFMMEPNGPIATAISLFPLSTPVAMMSRLSAGGVPWWQPWLAAVLLALTAVLVVKAVAGMFRAQTLLSGQPIKAKTFLKALVGK